MKWKDESTYTVYVPYIKAIPNVRRPSSNMQMWILVGHSSYNETSNVALFRFLVASGHHHFSVDLHETNLLQNNTKIEI